MGTAPKISVILGTYRGAHFLERSVRSVLRQSVKDFELIIINDASPDDTRGVVKSIRDERIVYLENASNAGVCKVRNLGLRHARGEFIAYCDHDDLYYPRHLEELARALERHPDAGLVFARYLLRCRLGPVAIQPDIPFSLQNLSTGDIIGPPLNVMHRKSCIKKVGGWDESRSINAYSCEDLDLWQRIAEHYPIYPISPVLGEFALHGTNRSFRVSFDKGFAYLFRKRWHAQKSRENRARFAAAYGIPIAAKLYEIRQHAQLSLLSEEFSRAHTGYQGLACKGIDLLAKADFRAAAALLEESLGRAPHPLNQLHTEDRQNILCIKLHLAKASLARQRIGDAFSLCKQILKECPAHRETLDLLAFQAMATRRYAQALRYLNRMPRYHTYFLRGLIAFLTDDLRTSEREFKWFIATATPIPLKGFFNLGMVYLKARKRAAAVRCFQQALRIAPRHPQARRLLRRLSSARDNWPGQPRVSVIFTPGENPQNFPAAVQAVLKQSLQNLELIIVDTGAGAPLRKPAMRFNDSRILYLACPGASLAQARNRGMEHALGAFIAYCSSDVHYSSSHLETLAGALALRPDCSLVYSDYLFIDARVGYSRARGMPFDRHRLEGYNFIPACTVMHRLICGENKRLFDPRLEPQSDWAAWLTIADAAQIAFVPQRSCRYYFPGLTPETRKALQRSTARLILQRIQAARKQNRLPEYARACALAAVEILIKAQQYPLARRIAESLGKDAPSYQAYACRGICLLAQGNYARARDLFGKALKGLPRATDPWTKDVSANIHLLYAQACMQQDTDALALRHCRKALRLSPGNTKAKLQLARLFCQKGDLSAAAGILKEKVYDAAFFNLRGCYYSLTGDRSGALREFERALILQPHTALYRRNREACRNALSATAPKIKAAPREPRRRDHQYRK